MGGDRRHYASRPASPPFLVSAIESVRRKPDERA